MSKPECSPVLEKTCEICRQTSCTDGDDIVYFGEWMTRKDITVHYYCLLLSTNLPQRGEDHSGILGFLLRDIRKEINLAKQRSCMYCQKKGASIMCFNCQQFFHLTCGHTNKCLSQFIGEFRSYCCKCLPLNEEQTELWKNPPDPKTKCFICSCSMGHYRPYSWIFASCCNNGYVHNLCLKKYALNAGYYLKCIWCKNKRFRDDIKYLGIFVPDRDANWEREKGAFNDLHRPQIRCDMQTCHCSKGRDYRTAQKWIISMCKLCGLVGAHNPFCIPGMEMSKHPVKEFKCGTCSIVENTIVEMSNESRSSIKYNANINSALYISKEDNNLSRTNAPDNANISDDSISNSSVETVVNNNLLKCIPSKATSSTIKQAPEQVDVPLLTQGFDDVTAMDIGTDSVIKPIENISLADGNNNPESINILENRTESFGNKLQNEQNLSEYNGDVASYQIIASSVVVISQTTYENLQCSEPNATKSPKMANDRINMPENDTGADGHDNIVSDNDYFNLEAIDIATNHLLDFFDT